jgi:hypothetical protein
MKGLQVAFVVGLWVLVGCGPAFTVDPRYLAGYDAGALRIDTAPDAGGPFAQEDASDAGEIRPGLVDAGDAGANVSEAGTPVPEDTGTHVPDASLDGGTRELVDAGDAGDVSAPPPPPPPPPALCCATPCSGSQVASVACVSASPWTCSAGSCEAEGACALGAACRWMGGACTGTVQVCP